jgi:hypothetical protein
MSILSGGNIRLRLARGIIQVETLMTSTKFKTEQILAPEPIQKMAGTKKPLVGTSGT